MGQAGGRRANGNISSSSFAVLPAKTFKSPYGQGSTQTLSRHNTDYAFTTTLESNRKILNAFASPTPAKLTGSMTNISAHPPSFRGSSQTMSIRLNRNVGARKEPVSHTPQRDPYSRAKTSAGQHGRHLVVSGSSRTQLPHSGQKLPKPSLLHDKNMLSQYQNFNQHRLISKEMVKRNEMRDKGVSTTHLHNAPAPNGVAIQANTEDPSSSQASPTNAYPVHFFAAQTQHLHGLHNNDNADLVDETENAADAGSKVITTLTKYSLQSGVPIKPFNPIKSGGQ